MTFSQSRLAIQMPSAARQYTAELKQQLRLLATWPPGGRIEVGDVGTIDRDNVFIRLTSLSALDIPFRAVPAGVGKEAIQYASEGGVEIGVKLAGKLAALAPHIPLSEAGLGLHFRRENATVFQADDIERSAIEDQVKLRDEIVAQIRAGRWDRDWSIVTEVLQARSTTVLIGRSNDSAIEFSVAAGIQGAGLDLLSVKAGIHTVASRDMALAMVGTDGATPLFRAVRVKRRFFLSGKPELRAAYADSLDRLAEGEAESEEDEDLFEGTPIYNGVTEALPAEPEK